MQSLHTDQKTWKGEHRYGRYSYIATRDFFENSNLLKCNAVSWASEPDVSKHKRTPVSTGNTFQDIPRLSETADNTRVYNVT